MIFWIKALHIILIAAWLSGLFYLPRIYMNLTLETEPAAIHRLLLMARKLLRFMTIIAAPALGLGIWLWAGFAIGWHQGWPHAKLAIALLLVIYHIVCWRQLTAFEDGRNTHTSRWYRVFNELPALALSVAVILAVVKPF